MVWWCTMNHNTVDYWSSETCCFEYILYIFNTAHLKDNFVFLLWPSLKIVLGVYGTTCLLINNTLQTWFGNEIFEQIDSIYMRTEIWKHLIYKMCEQILWTLPIYVQKKALKTKSILNAIFVLFINYLLLTYLLRFVFLFLPSQS
jgi:hypothetical protein